MQAGRPARLRRAAPSRARTGCGQVMPCRARCSIRPRNQGSSAGSTRFSYSVRMKSPAVVRSEKLLFSTPSAMPRNATTVPRS